MSYDDQKKDHFSIDPASVAATRAELLKIVRGNSIAEAAVEGFSDWEAVEAMERLLTVATSETSSMRKEGSIDSRLREAFGLTEG